MEASTTYDGLLIVRGTRRLNTCKETQHTRYKQSKNKFTRLKVISYRLNEIWSIDLADMQALADHNDNIRYLLVAVDTLSRFLRVEPIHFKTAVLVKGAFQRMLQNGGGGGEAASKPEKVWCDKGKEFQGVFKSSL